MRRVEVLASSWLALQTILAPAQGSLPDAPAAKPIVYEAGGEVTAPKLVYAVVPEYTEEARKHRIQGSTTLSLVVDEQGNPQVRKVTRSLSAMVDPKYRAAARDLDDKAVEAARQYRFEPGLLKGKPVAVAIDLDVYFHLI